MNDSRFREVVAIGSTRIPVVVVRPRMDHFNFNGIAPDHLCGLLHAFGDAARPTEELTDLVGSHWHTPSVVQAYESLTLRTQGKDTLGFGHLFEFTHPGRLSLGLTRSLPQAVGDRSQAVE